MTLSRVFLETTLLTGQLAENSLVAYRADLHAYLAFCGDPETALEAFSLARWRVHLAHDTRLSPWTINRRLSAVRRVVKEAAVQGYVDFPTAEAFRRVPGVVPKAMQARLRQPTRVTPAQMRLLCDTPDRSTLKGWRDRALLLVLASSACRVSEICRLTTGQIRIEGGNFFLEVVGKNQTMPRLAPLSHEAYAAVQAWLARRSVMSPYVFTSLTGKRQRPTPRPLDRSAAWRIVQRYARAIALARVSPHDCRRFVGTQLAKKDIRQAQKALGHARIETTAKFYVLDELEGGLTDNLF